MMHFIPKLYSDELFYSIISRYHIRSGNLSYSHTFEDLFGSGKTVIPSVEIQSNLESFVSNLPIGSDICFQDILMKNTLFPYYAAFVPEERVIEAREIVKRGNLSRAYNKLGIASLKSNHSKFLRHCKYCLQEDTEEYGESYWRRIHQIPGIELCVYHKEKLYNSKESVDSRYRQSIIIPNKESINWNENKKNNCEISKQLLIARNSLKLLNKDFVCCDHENIKKIYINKLIEMGVAYRNGMVKQKEFKTLIIEHWGESFLKQLGVWGYLNEKDNPFNKALRSSKQVVNPLIHLVICGTLDLDIEKVIDSELPINNYYEEWERDIITAVKEKNSLRCIASRYNTTRNSIQKIIENNKIEAKWNYNGGGTKIPYTESEKYKSKIVIMRERWIQLSDANPNLSRNKIRQLDDRLYSWLIRYDREWLLKNSVKYSTENRVSIWEEREIDYYPLIVNTVEEMKNGKPQRITINSVGGKLGIRTWLYRRNMPKISEYLDGELEDIETFWLRRIEWAIEELNNTETNITISSVIKLSGVNRRQLSELIKYNNRLSEVVIGLNNSNYILKICE